LFQQIGGTVGLAIAGTVFGARLAEELPRQLAESSLPPQIATRLATSGGAAGQLVGVGDLGKAILAGAPPEAQAQLAPFIPEIVAAIHRAFSLAVASTFAFGIVAAVVALAGQSLPRSPRAYGHLMVMAIVNIALPFVLITWAERNVESSLAAILTSVVPLFVVVLAPLFIEDEPMRANGIVGLVIGF